MTANVSEAIAEAYRWQRGLGNVNAAAPHCLIVANPSRPHVWDANHACAVTARAEDEITSVFASMDRHLGHTPWRVVHTDGFTPDAFLARLALDDYEEQPATIQMILRGGLTSHGAPVEIRPVLDSADWTALHHLVALDHAEGQRTGGRDLPPDVTAGIVASYRAKSVDYHFHVAVRDGLPIAYGAYAAAPNGAGMIEDLFTVPSARRQGIATALISTFTERLRAAGSHAIFIGALATGHPKRLYARLGFHPIGLTRVWVKKTSSGPREDK